MAEKFTDLGRLYDYLLRESKATIELEVAEEIKNILKKFINKNFYEKYRINPTNQLWDSIKVRSIRNGRQIVGLDISFDIPSVNHTSLFGSSNLGIKKGSKVYTPQWINDGWTFAPSDMQGNFRDGLTRIRDIAEEPHFMEDTIDVLNGSAPHIRKYIASLRSKKIMID